MELKNKKGFTIIELLIVITMIGILIVLAGSLSSKFAARRNIDYMGRFSILMMKEVICHSLLKEVTVIEIHQIGLKQLVKLLV